MTRAMFLCAGLGTRLGEMGKAVPKPLLPVCNVPILRYGIANLAAQGITDIVINLFHQGQEFERELGDGSALGVRIQYSKEETLLGTGGGLKHALHLLDPDQSDEPFLSLNGKLIFDVAAAPILDAYKKLAKGTLGMMVVRPVPDAEDWGAVDVDDGGRVQNILGKGKYMFCGVHVTRPSVVRRLPDGEACMIRQGYLPWLQKGEFLGAHVVDPDRYFAEHSTPERYLQSNFDLLSGAQLKHPPANLVGIHPTAQIDSTAVITAPVCIGKSVQIGARARVGPHAVVGDQAVIAPDANVSRAVIWARAHVTGTVTNAVRVA